MALALEDFVEQAIKRNKVSQAYKEVLARGVEMVKRCHAEGIYVLFTDGLRTMTDQATLYGKGRASYIYGGKQYGNPKVGKVTNALPGNSFHNYGLALDFVLTDANAKEIFWTRNKKWERAAAIAKELGFTWGGDWKGFVDNPHIEYTNGLTLSQIKIGKVPVFKAFKPIGKVEDELKFSSASLKNTVMKLTTDKKLQEAIIGEGVTIKAFNESWRDKFIKGGIEDGDWVGLYILYLTKKGGK